MYRNVFSTIVFAVETFVQAVVDVRRRCVFVGRERDKLWDEVLRVPGIAAILGFGVGELAGRLTGTETLSLGTRQRVDELFDAVVGEREWNAFAAAGVARAITLDGGLFGAVHADFIVIDAGVGPVGRGAAD